MGKGEKRKKMREVDTEKKDGYASECREKPQDGPALDVEEGVGESSNRRGVTATSSEVAGETERPREAGRER